MVQRMLRNSSASYFLVVYIKEWFLFIDDLSVATGRPPPQPPGPSGAHGISNLIAQTDMMRGAKGLDRIAKSDTSPYAHVSGIRRRRSWGSSSTVVAMLVLLACICCSSAR